MILINAIADTKIVDDNCVSWDENNVQENIAVSSKHYYFNGINHHPIYHNLWGFREVLYIDQNKQLHYTKKVDLYLDGEEIVTREYFSTSILNKILKTKMGLIAREFIKISHTSP